jgi:hypothetical protein
MTDEQPCPDPGATRPTTRRVDQGATVRGSAGDGSEDTTTRRTGRPARRTDGTCPACTFVFACLVSSMCPRCRVQLTRTPRGRYVVYELEPADEPAQPALLSYTDGAWRGPARRSSRETR